MVNRFLKTTLIIFIMVTIFNVNINKVSALGSHDIDYTNYYGIEMTETEYFNLINLGFTENEIYYMDEDTYNENKDENDARLLTKNTKYYKTVVPYYGTSYTTEVTLAEYLNHSNGDDLLDNSSTYYQEFVTSISYKNETKYRYKISTNWLHFPSNYSFDVIGIGLGSIDDVYINSNLFFRFDWAYSDGSSHHSTVNNGSQTSATGGSIVYELPTNVVGLSATLYYDVSKDTEETITSLEMCGDYSHSNYQVTQYQAANHAISYYGIGFDSSVVAYFNAIPCTYAAVYDISW